MDTPGCAPSLRHVDMCLCAHAQSWGCVRDRWRSCRTLPSQLRHQRFVSKDCYFNPCSCATSTCGLADLHCYRRPYTIAITIMQLLAFAALQFFAALAAALPQGGEWSRENNDDCWVRDQILAIATDPLVLTDGSQNPTVFSVVSTTVTSYVTTRAGRRALTDSSSSTHTTTTTSFARGKTITAPTSTVTEFVTAYDSSHTP